MAAQRMRRRYGTGIEAVRVRTIAEAIAVELADDTLDDEDAERRVYEAARRCPLVRSDMQARAIADGWMGRFYGDEPRNLRRQGHSAGRQLASMRSMFVGPRRRAS